MWQPFEDEFDADPTWKAPEEGTLNIPKLIMFVLGVLALISTLAFVGSL